MAWGSRVDKTYDGEQNEIKHDDEVECTEPAMKDGKAIKKNTIKKTIINSKTARLLRGKFFLFLDPPMAIPPSCRGFHFV